MSNANKSYQPTSYATGTIFYFGNSPLPFGFLPCDGKDIYRKDWPALFSVIGTIYGAGSALTFRTPNPGMGYGIYALLESDSVITPTKKVPVCECGKEKHGFAGHAYWCDIKN